MIRLYWKGDRLALSQLVNPRESDLPEFDWFLQCPNSQCAWGMTQKAKRELEAAGCQTRLITTR